MASGYPRDIPNVPRERNLKGISFAVANASGFVARAMEAVPGAGLPEILEALTSGTTPDLHVGPHPMSTPVDVLVIGGGPAGATAAGLLASWGRSVALIHHESSKPSLAESLPASTRKLLRFLGQLEEVDSAGFHPNQGNISRWAGKEARARLACKRADRRFESSSGVGRLASLSATRRGKTPLIVPTVPRIESVAVDRKITVPRCSAELPPRSS